VPTGRPGIYAVEPDATAASYFAALPLVVGGFAATSTGLLPAGNSLQGDIRFLDILTQCGAARLAGGDRRHSVSFAPGGRRHGGARRLFRVLRHVPDPGRHFAAPRGPDRIIRGIGHTRKQETDRVAGMAAELRRLGQEVTEKEDSLEIQPRPLRQGVTVETHGDHRFAMSFADPRLPRPAGRRHTRGSPSPIPACSAKTFPGFFDLLERVRAKSLEA
jgi:3-phosphoshikimate 1-carboxyvinyltransferase